MISWDQEQLLMNGLEIFAAVIAQCEEDLNATSTWHAIMKMYFILL